MAAPRRALTWVSNLFLLTIAITSVSASLSDGLRRFSSRNSDQTPILLSNELVQICNYSVGFSLQSSYVTASVIIEYPDGSEVTVTRDLEGGSAYRETMERLSLRASRRPERPLWTQELWYQSRLRVYQERLRVWKRKARKLVGLPATPDIDVLGGMVRRMRSHVESEFHIPVTNAVLAITHLTALYGDDGQDICEFAGIVCVLPSSEYRLPLWETAAAYAGYGFGICEHFRSETECWNETASLPLNRILAVHYSHAALTMSMPLLEDAASLDEPGDMHREHFELVSDAIDLYSHSDEYWQTVKSAMLDSMAKFPTVTRPQFIIVTGDSRVHGKFIRLLEEAMEECLGFIPTIYSDDATLVTARGAAELRRRASYPVKYQREPWKALSGECVAGEGFTLSQESSDTAKS